MINDPNAPEAPSAHGSELFRECAGSGPPTLSPRVVTATLFTALSFVGGAAVLVLWLRLHRFVFSDDIEHTAVVVTRAAAVQSHLEMAGVGLVVCLIAAARLRQRHDPWSAAIAGGLLLALLTVFAMPNVVVLVAAILGG